MRVQKNPDKYLSKDLITKLEEKDPLWRLTFNERRTLTKLEKCFEFYKKYQYWPTDCKKNKNYPLDDGETFDIGVFWYSIKIGNTTISDIYYKKNLELDPTVVINKKRKRED